ncbi:MAG TPA: ABC transporter permease [Solirubrobacteraceae bacterium]|nr:ABC transporter permease [Solirubrobacteraceae bacterium]
MTAAAARSRISLRRRRAADASRIPPRELLSVALQGIRTRKLRAFLSALGIAIGIGAMVAVVGVSASSQANLLALIDRLGPNLLTVSPGQTFSGDAAVLPTTAVGSILHMRSVQQASAVYQVSAANVLRTPYVPANETGGIGVDATDPELLAAVSAKLATGRFIDPANQRYPVVVLGAQAAATLQIFRVNARLQVFLGGTWFTVIGILEPVTLDSTLDSTAFIGLPVAARLFQTRPNPSEIYVQAGEGQVTQTAKLLPATADPQQPDGTQIGVPVDALKARAAAAGQFTTLLLGLGAVALLVGAIGIANIMVISVLERRVEIGLRRALGATRHHITLQFLTESALLAALGGIAGLVLGALATLANALGQNEPMVIPTYVLVAAPAAGLAIGVLSGLYPAAKAARLSPTEALRTV